MDVSYAVCGIPYAVGENFDELTPRNAEWFKRYDVDIHTSEITQVDYDKKLVHGINLITKIIYQ